MTHMRVLLATVLALACLAGCAVDGPGQTEQPAATARNPYANARALMVSVQIEARGVSDQRVLAAMRDIPRHEFVPAGLRAQAYSDRPLPIEFGQTISQPYIVAYMTEVLELKPGDKVLEIGTGSGYQAAVLAKLAQEVFSIEIVCGLERSARERLDSLGFGGIKTKCADGYKGWPEEAPFDAIMLTAAPERIPPPLLEQLADGGRLVAPVGDRSQKLVRIRREGKDLREEDMLPVIFVPMTGEAQRK